MAGITKVLRCRKNAYFLGLVFNTPYITQQSENWWAYIEWSPPQSRILLEKLTVDQLV